MKKFFVFILSLLIIITFYVKVYAVIPSGYTAVSFLNGGNNFIYSDNPESFSVTPNDLFYLWGASLNTTPKDVEMYHILYNGWNSNNKLMVGIAIRNSNNSPVTITFKGSGNTWDIQSNQSANAFEKTPVILRDYFNASYTYVTIPAYSTQVVYAINTNFVTGNYKFVFIRAQFQSSLSSNVWMRLFVAGENKINSTTFLNDLFNISSPNAPGTTNTFTGELSYTQKITTLDANVKTTYRFCEWPRPLSNINEYTGVVTYKSGGLDVNAGNFGVVYKININNANGKRIKIIPDWSNKDRQYATILYRLNGSSWTVGSTISYGQCWYISLGTNNSATFEFVLPGGNYGNYDISFD